MNIKKRTKREIKEEIYMAVTLAQAKLNVQDALQML